MAKINFVVPPLTRRRFTGGIWCVMQYAHGLVRRGHMVRVVPLLPSPPPDWFAYDYGQLVTPTVAELVGVSSRKAARAVGCLGRKILRRPVPGLKSSVEDAIASMMLFAARGCPYEIRRGLALRYMRDVIPSADVTVATSFETALPVALFGSGRRCYFAQHYEVYFKDETGSPLLAERDARASYDLGLDMIANSSWLKGMIEVQVPSAAVAVCPNAIDHGVFHGSAREAAANDVTVISYGGRNAEWKGFREMAAAVRIARETLPGVRLRWQVYGEALLPPDNPIAPYEALGFLSPPCLAEAYRRADILLSASWYESFPLFPLEAMACGLAVVTTQPGTEEYAVPGQTAEVVEARNPEHIAAGLLRLIREPHYRASLTREGQARSRQFTWERSVSTFERLVLAS